MMAARSIVRRTYYSIDVDVISPISISSGENENTDSDVLCNGTKEYFIPGTSLAGAFRNYLGKTKEEDCEYGFSKGESGRMSSVFISDLYFTVKEKNTTIIKSIRDGVALGEEKNVNNKFDMEIIEPGIKGEIRLEIIERVGDKYDVEKTISSILKGIESGEIRIGANKNRGFGRLKIERIRSSCFDKARKGDWINFCALRSSVDEQNDQDNKESESKNYKGKYDTSSTYGEWIKDKNTDENKYIKICLPLILDGGISIRKYSTTPGKADFEHITCNGKPVIPGTSWNGAIRADAKRILKVLGCNEKKIKQLIDGWFGFVAVDRDSNLRKDKKASQSMIVISESVIENSKAVPMTRNKINRFTSGTKGGALYSEIAYFGGNTTLEYMIRKTLNYKALIGLMSLISEDIMKGYVAVGGQTGIGRGIFKQGEQSQYNIDIDGISLNECMAELYEITK